MREGGRVGSILCVSAMSHHLNVKSVFVQHVAPGHNHGHLVLNLLEPFQGLLYLHQEPGLLGFHTVQLVQNLQ